MSSRLFRASWLIEGVAVLNVFLVDDHEVVRRGVADLLEEDLLAALTDQERTLLDLIGEGLTNRQIAGRMFLAEKTVKNYYGCTAIRLSPMTSSMPRRGVAGTGDP